MKLFTLAFSVYIFVLSIVTCTDAIIQNEWIADDTELSDSDHSHDHSDHSDDCTPFCTCTCCGSFLIAPSSQNLETPIRRNITKYVFTYDFEYSLEYNKGIWHPPTAC